MFKLSNKAYDILELVSLLATPLVAFVMAMTDVWGFAYGAEIAATISALGVLAGAILTKSSADYRKESGENDG